MLRRWLVISEAPFDILAQIVWRFCRNETSLVNLVVGSRDDVKSFKDG